VLPGYTCAAVMFDFMKIVMLAKVHELCIAVLKFLHFIYIYTFSLIIGHVYAFG